MIEIEGLVKRFGRHTAVAGLDLKVMPGEIFGFLGPNGAGKTTTVKCITGLLKPTAGRVRVAGFDTATQTLAAKRAMAYGTVMSSFNVEDFSTRNIENLDRDRIDERFSDLLDRMSVPRAGDLLTPRRPIAA